MKIAVLLSLSLLSTFCWADFDVQQATRDYLNQLSPEDVQRSNAYFEGGYWILLGNFLYGALISFFLLSSGLSVKLRNISQKFTRFRGLHNFLYFTQYMLVATLLAFPFTYYVDFLREHQYGLSNLSFGGWMSELFKGLGMGIVLGGVFVALIYWIVRKIPRTWWMAGAVVSVLFVLFINLIFPVFIAPVFNQYKPLEPGPLKESIISLARANGIPADNVYQFDASKQSKRISANVSGLLGTTRISLNDNLLNRTTPEEIQAVMGHEMGHYVLNHSTRLSIYMGLVLLLAFFFVHWSFGRLSRIRDKWKLGGIEDIANIPLVIFLFSAFFLGMTPVTNSIVRSAEAEADIFGLNAAREPDGFARTALKLSEYRKLDPGPLEEIIFYDHPSGRARIEMAMKWKKENLSKEFSSQAPPLAE